MYFLMNTVKKGHPKNSDYLLRKLIWKIYRNYLNEVLKEEYPETPNYLLQKL